MARPRRGSSISGSSLGELDVFDVGVSSSSNNNNTSGGNNNNNNNNIGSGAGQAQELGSMYDYLAKIILLGPSGAGKSCVLHRFLRGEWRALSSQTIGVEFGSKIVALGSGSRRTRLKLQLWDTAGTERFRAVSRSYYRGAAGALLIYDVASYPSFAALPNFLRDARALASPRLSVVLAGNKLDVDEAALPDVGDEQSVRLGASSVETASLSSKISTGSFAQADSDVWGSVPNEASADGGDEEGDEWGRRAWQGVDIETPRRRASNNSSSVPPTPSSTTGSTGSASTVRYAMTGQQPATHAPHGREVDAATASRWASGQSVPVSVEVSALTGAGVDDAFRRLAQMILTKIELGEIDPDDPQSGIQYGDAGWYYDDGADGHSIRSDGTGATLRRRKGKGARASTGSGLREWEAVFRLDKRGGRRRACC